MDFEKLKQNLQSFKGQGTKQSWRMDTDFNYENAYLRVIRIDSSNVAGGADTNKGKQWSIIIDIKKSFINLPNWIMVQNYFCNEINITKVKRGSFIGKSGIRLYKMTTDPTNEIIRDFLDFIFSE